VIVLLIFGARRIPEIARSLGSGAREFREGISGNEPPEEGRETPAERARHDEGPDRPA